ncbi:MAG: pitrilysin family protein [Patescibacteria group bacterium]|nr:pitrilysin family protein [Patescibacteria group bacterium]
MPKVKTLKNGLNFVSVPVGGTKAATFLVMVPVGSRYENKKINGASHFVEHLMFKGTAKRPTTLHISRELDAVGAQFNAFTNKDYTGYYIKIDGAKRALALDILSDMLFNSKFEAEEIAKEKGVIIEEIKMYEDNPSMAVDRLFDALMFGDRPLGWDIAGTINGIKKMSRAELWKYYKDAYAPANMVLVAAGNIGKDINKLAQKYFGVTRATAKIGKDDYIKFNWSGKKSLAQRVSAQKRKIDQAHVLIGFPGLKYNDPRRYAIAVMLTILGAGMSSRLFVEVREKRGLAYRIRASSFAHRDVGAVTISAGLDVGRLKQAFDVIFAECAKITAQLVSKKELEDAKNNLAGTLALTMEDSSAQADWFAEKFWFASKVETYEEALKKIKKVTLGEVKKIAAQIFKPEQARVAVISPLDKTKIVKLLN